ncbi:MAG TPA: histidine phosphatase family protein [Thermoplasmata archaeon]|jgi:broad specificity phosphatase PhoE
MRVVEHRRHSRRDPADMHLSRDGVELARRVAPTLGRFDRVVASPKPRAVETAQALGLPLDAVLPDLGVMPDDVGLAVDPRTPRSFADYVRVTERSEAMAEYALRQSTLMREELERLPEGGRLLMVSHGGVIEFGAAASRPQDAVSWGPPAGYLEGVRLFLDQGEWVRGEILRVPK